MHTTNNVEVSPIELSEEELSAVSAGKSDAFTKFGDIEGETTTSHIRAYWVQML